MNFEIKEKYNFEDLLKIITVLRSDNGCMWDKEQNHKSIRKNFIEEVYEAIEAIDTDDVDLLREELGDVLLQIVFHAEMEREIGSFDMDDVCDGVCKKLVYRHPHIFSDVKVDSTKEILSNWEELKKAEKGRKSTTDSMQNIAKSLPSLMRAAKIGKYAAKVGFDWDTAEASLEKVREETDEILDAIRGNGNIEEELGDLLFAVVNLSRHLKVDAEQALYKANEKFISRFEKVEQEITRKNSTFDETPLEDMEKIWQSVK